MKPNVFLSHSKADKPIIERIANDLRAARITVWYDEWEIPAGESFRRKIFEDGIPSCDVFFVYFTVASIASYWVSKELDAAFVVEAETKGIAFATFVSSDDIRSKLSIDLQSLHSPVLNDTDYSGPLVHLVSRIWEVVLNRRLKGTEDSYTGKILQLEKNNLELENRLLRLQAGNIVDPTEVERQMRSEILHIGERQVTVWELFTLWWRQLAPGTTNQSLNSSLKNYLGLGDEPYNLWIEYKFSIDEALAPMIILGIVSVRAADADNYKTYYLTESGIGTARALFVERQKSMVAN